MLNLFSLWSNLLISHIIHKIILIFLICHLVVWKYQIRNLDTCHEKS